MTQPVQIINLPKLENHIKEIATDAINRDSAVASGISGLFSFYKDAVDAQQQEQIKQHLRNVLKPTNWVAIVKRSRVEFALKNDSKIKEFYTVFGEDIKNAAILELNRAGLKPKERLDAFHALIAVWRNTTDKKLKEEVGGILRQNLIFLVQNAPRYYDDKEANSKAAAKLAGRNAGDIRADVLISYLDLAMENGLFSDHQAFADWTDEMWGSVGQNLGGEKKTSARVTAYFSGQENAAAKTRFFYEIYGRKKGVAMPSSGLPVLSDLADKKIQIRDFLKATPDEITRAAITGSNKGISKINMRWTDTFPKWVQAPTPEGEDKQETDAFKQLFRYLHYVNSQNPNSPKALSVLVGDQITKDCNAASALPGIERGDLNQVLTRTKNLLVIQQRLAHAQTIVPSMAQLDIAFDPIKYGQQLNSAVQLVSKTIGVMSGILTNELNPLLSAEVAAIDEEVTQLEVKAKNATKIDEFDAVTKDVDAVKNKLSGLKQKIEIAKTAIGEPIPTEMKTEADFLQQKLQQLDTINANLTSISDKNAKAKQYTQDLEKIKGEIAALPVPDLNAADYPAQLKAFIDKKAEIETKKQAIIADAGNLFDVTKNSLLAVCDSLGQDLTVKIQGFLATRKEYIDNKIQPVLNTINKPIEGLQLEALKALKAELDKIDLSSLQPVVNRAEASKGFIAGYANANSLLDPEPNTAKTKLEADLNAQKDLVAAEIQKQEAEKRQEEERQRIANMTPQQRQEAVEREKREQAQREELARKEAERKQKEQEQQEKLAREKADREQVQRARQEKLAREKAERDAREQAERKAQEEKVKYEKLPAELDKRIAQLEGQIAQRAQEKELDAIDPYRPRTQGVEDLRNMEERLKIMKRDKQLTLAVAAWEFKGTRFTIHRDKIKLRRDLIVGIKELLPKIYEPGKDIVASADRKALTALISKAQTKMAKESNKDPSRMLQAANNYLGIAIPEKTVTKAVTPLVGATPAPAAAKTTASGFYMDNDDTPATVEKVHSFRDAPKTKRYITSRLLDELEHIALYTPKGFVSGRNEHFFDNWKMKYLGEALGFLSLDSNPEIRLLFETVYEVEQDNNIRRWQGLENGGIAAIRRSFLERFDKVSGNSSLVGLPFDFGEYDFDRRSEDLQKKAGGVRFFDPNNPKIKKMTSMERYFLRLQLFEALNKRMLADKAKTAQIKDVLVSETVDGKTLLDFAQKKPGAGKIEDPQITVLREDLEKIFKEVVGLLIDDVRLQHQEAQEKTVTVAVARGSGH